MNNLTNSSDIKDSARDEKRLQGDEVTIDMPDVSDIPGQEHIHPLPNGEMTDSTVSSKDEEGYGLLDDLNGASNEEELGINDDVDVTPLEKQLLSDATNHLPTDDEDALRKSEFDTTDDDGDILNEKSDESGSDLDVPGSELDDADEEIGEEDEENNGYSMGQK